MFWAVVDDYLWHVEGECRAKGRDENATRRRLRRRVVEASRAGRREKVVAKKAKKVGLTMAGRLGESRRGDKGVEDGLCCVEEEDPQGCCVGRNDL